MGQKFHKRQDMLQTITMGFWRNPNLACHNNILFLSTESLNKLNTSNQSANYEMVSEMVWHFDINFINRTKNTFRNVSIT